MLAETLKLVPLTVEEVHAMVEGMSPSERTQLSPDWLAQIYSPTGVDQWALGYRMVRVEDEAAIGQCGFKSPPRSGIVEIAYGVAEQYEGRGYATEAARALVSLAFASDEVQVVIAHTLERGNASARVLSKLAFESVGQVNDPDDGLVWKWERKRDKS